MFTIISFIILCNTFTCFKNPSPLHPVERAMCAPFTIVGEVIEIEKDTVESTWRDDNSPNKINFTIAKVKVHKVLIGEVREIEIRVGFSKLDRNYLSEKASPPLQLAVGEVKCMFLHKHFSEKFFIEAGLSPTLEPNSKTDEDAFKLVERAVKVIRNPKKSLQANSAKDRLFAAVCLAYYKHPHQPEGNPKELSEEMTILILKAFRGSTLKLVNDSDLPNWELALFNKLQLIGETSKGKIDYEKWKEKFQDSENQTAHMINVYVEWYDGLKETPKIYVYFDENK